MITACPFVASEEIVVTDLDLGDIYRRYLACLNQRDWASLGQFVGDEVTHNGRPFGLSGYRRMLEQDVLEIPDLQFNLELLVVEAPTIASRLQFDCTPAGIFLGLPINGRRIKFAENVFYTFRDAKIAEVWSVLDKAAIEAQI
ncbi:Predicted ester cyclase [Pararobbsia alpina]